MPAVSAGFAAALVVTSAVELAGRLALGVLAVVLASALASSLVFVLGGGLVQRSVQRSVQHFHAVVSRADLRLVQSIQAHDFDALELAYSARPRSVSRLADRLAAAVAAALVVLVSVLTFAGVASRLVCLARLLQAVAAARLSAAAPLVSHCLSVRC